jgi:hypothetical protein
MEAWRRRLASQRQDLLDDDEDEMALKVLIDNLGMENEIQKWKSHGGSRPGKRANIDREHEVGHERIMKDYFGEDPVYLPHILGVAFECNGAYF